MRGVLIVAAGMRVFVVSCDGLGVGAGTIGGVRFRGLRAALAGSWLGLWVLPFRLDGGFVCGLVLSRAARGWILCAWFRPVGCG
jgi:hypothetical protein